MKKVIVIVGPTAVGKSKVAVNLAKHYGSEIISGDSIQVFKGVDIGSGKIKEEETLGVKHHLIDILEPGEYYSVSDFQTESRKLIEELELPFIVGGTGLYIKACLTDYNFSGEKRDYDFEHQYDNYSDEELYNVLLECDKEQAQIIHPHNRKRVLRAIYNAKTGNKMSLNKGKDKYLYDAFIIYLNAERSYLYDKINKRVDQMVKEGLLEENERLFKQNIFVNGIGYQEFIPYFNGEATLDDVVLEIKKNSRHYAKRQMTWFNNQMTSSFYNINDYKGDELIDKLIEDIDLFLKK